METAAAADRKTYRILLVEDSPADAGLVREALEEHAVRCELLVISNGESAINYIGDLDTGTKTGCPDLVILDLNLPRRTGMEVLTRMRESVNCSRVPVAILTSSDNQRDKEQAAQLGASRYFRKPSRLAEFLELGNLFKQMLGDVH